MSKGGKVRFEKVEEKNVPQFIGLMEKLVKGNDGTHLVGSKITYADIAFACLLDTMAMDPLWSLDPQTVMPPPLDELCKMVKDSPNIKA